MKVAYESVISKPPEVVFPWIADPEKAKKWQKDVKEEKILIDKPEMVGTTFKEIVEEDGNQLEIDGTITEFVVNKMIAFHLESKIHAFDARYVLEALDSKTKFRIDANIRWKFPMNVISLIIGKKIEANLIKKLEAETQDLRELCERE